MYNTPCYIGVLRIKPGKHFLWWFKWNMSPWWPMLWLIFWSLYKFHLIQLSGTRHQRVPDLQILCRDLTKWQGTSIRMIVMDAGDMAYIVNFIAIMTFNIKSICVQRDIYMLLSCLQSSNMTGLIHHSIILVSDPDKLTELMQFSISNGKVLQ